MDQAAAAAEYSAFISYNKADRRWAVWLHRALENYRIPRRLRGRSTRLGILGERLPRAFRDRDELAASGDLGQAVKDALARSRTLVVICSPNAVRSIWVNDEIRHFRSLGRGADIQCLIIGGVPHAADPAQECLPPALFENDGVEPLAADIGKQADGRASARLKIIAGVLGVPFDELRQREAARRQRRLAMLAAGSTAAFVGTAALAVFALVSRQEAIAQRDIARKRTLTAERTVDFVKSMFDVSDPAVAQGADITARQILEQARSRIATGLAEEPAVRTELQLTLSDVYNSLGLYPESEALARGTFRIAQDDPVIAMHQWASLGDAQFQRGAYREAVASYSNGLRIGGQARQDAPELVSRMLAFLGQAQSQTRQYKAAAANIEQALASDRARLGERHPDVARDLEALGLNDYYARDFASAKRLMEQALAIRLHAEGEKSPNVATDLSNLGSIAYDQGDGASAERYARRNLRYDEAVLGPDHPDLAATLNDLARPLIDRRAFAEAEPLLLRAVGIEVKQRGGAYDDLAFMYANLALAQQGLGRLPEAQANFDKALAVARATNHVNLALVLTDSANLKCRTGHVDDGLALLGEARPVMVRTFPYDPWRVAWTDNVRAECLLRNGQRDVATVLLQSSGPVLRARWDRTTYYGFEAERRQNLLAAGSAGTSAAGHRNGAPEPATRF